MKKDNKSIEERLDNLDISLGLLHAKVDELSRGFSHSWDTSKKINEIHALHFSKKSLEKEDNLTEKFLAEILLGTPTRRRKK